MQYRQGDIFLQQCSHVDVADMEELPRDGKRIVLAYGEATGHAHAIHEPHAVLLEAPDRQVYLRVIDHPVSLRHEEHSKISVPPGIYRVTRQREYTPEEIRTVAD